MLKQFPFTIVAVLVGMYAGAVQMQAHDQRNSEQELALSFGCGYLQGQLLSRDKLSWPPLATHLEQTDCPFYRAVALNQGVIRDK